MHALRSSTATAPARARASRPSRAAAVRCAASGGGDASQFKIPEGASVRVTKPVTVFHAPKSPPEGIALEGMQGKVLKHAAVHKDGRVLSANLPYRVAFELPPADAGAKPVKFQAHLEECEIEVV